MIGRLRGVLRRSAVLQRWRFAAYFIPYRLLSTLFRVRPSRTVFLSDSRPDYSGNIALLRDETLRQDSKADVIGVFKPALRARRSLRDMARLIWVTATAQSIVLDDYYPLIYAFRIRQDTRLVQVWHAAGAFKRVGYSRAGLPGGPLPGSIIHRNYTDVTVSAESIRENYAQAFGVDADRVKALGVPRTDVFFDENTVAVHAAMIRRRYDIRDDQKIALFAPTFRGRGQLSATFDYDSIDWAQVAAELGDDWVMLVKMHPFVTPLSQARPGLRGVIDVSDEREITDLLMAADVLVTDYSSTIFDYALLHRPIVFFCPDLEQYTADRDFYYPFERYLAGPLVTETGHLADAIRTATTGARHQEFLEFFMGACDGKSTERIVRELIRTPRNGADSRHTGNGTSRPAATAATRATSASVFSLMTAHAARVCLNIAYAPLRLLPRRRKVVMISREHHQAPDDFVDIAIALRRADPTLPIVMLVRMVPETISGKITYIGHLAIQLYHVATARVLMVDTYAMVASLLRHGSGLTVIQIWHALGALKKFGRSILGTPEGRDRRLANAMRMHRGYDVVLASGAGCRPAYAEAFGTDVDRVVVAPLPRVDRLLDPVLAAATRHRFFAAYPHLRHTRIAVFAPTLRIDDAIPLDTAAMSTALADIGIHLVVKAHPLMTEPVLPAENISDESAPDERATDEAATGGAATGEAATGGGADIAAATPPIDTADDFSTQDLLQVAEVFITDYSSALYEAAVLGLPCYFLAPDLEAYTSSRDFYLDYRHDLPGPIVGSVAELAEAIAAGRGTAEASQEFGARWVQLPRHVGPSGPSSTPCADTIAALVLVHTNET